MYSRWEPTAPFKKPRAILEELGVRGRIPQQELEVEPSREGLAHLTGRYHMVFHSMV